MSSHHESNVIGGPLASCPADHRGVLSTSGGIDCVVAQTADGEPAVCVIVTQDFLRHQRALGNELTVPDSPQRFPGLRPGESWCISAAKWLASHEAGHAAPVVLAATPARALSVVDLDVLVAHAADVPSDPGGLIS